jgi:hypothetical protein
MGFVVGGAVAWGTGTLLKHWWSHQAWDHAVVDALPLGVFVVVGTWGQEWRRARRRRKRQRS